MFTSLLSFALLSTTVLGAPQERRSESNAEAFTTAADHLIFSYLPYSIYPSLSAVVSSAASEAKVTGDPLAIVYSALLETSVPAWFKSAIPTEWYVLTFLLLSQDTINEHHANIRKGQSNSLHWRAVSTSSVQLPLLLQPSPLLHL